MPKSELPNPLERKKDKGKREKCGKAANLFNFSSLQPFNETIPI